MSSNRPKFPSLFSVPNPSTILVRNSPLEKIIQIDPVEFAHQQGMTDWTETILIKDNLNIDQSEEFNEQIIDAKNLQHIIERTQFNSKNIIIAFQNQELGWGVFTQTKIAKLDYVAIYAGIQMGKNFFDLSNNRDYVFGLEQKGTEIGVIQAKDYGNKARFIQHAPLALTNYAFHQAENKKKVLTANLLAYPYKFNNSFVIVLRALEEIQENKWLCFDYNDYWLSIKKHPFLMDTLGDIVPSSQYQVNSYICRIYFKDGEKDIFLQSSISKEQANNFCNVPQIYGFTNLGYEGQIEISANTFSMAFNQRPITSPYIFINNPDKIVYTKKLEPMVKTANESKENNLTNFNLGIFANQKNDICGELSRITKSFSNITWKYSIKNDTAFLEHADREIINTIEEIFKKKFSTKSGINPKNNMRLLYLVKPKVELLKLIPTYKKEEKNVDLGEFRTNMPSIHY